MGRRKPDSEQALGAMELHACRRAKKQPEAAAQQEILVAGNKETAMVTHLGAVSSAQEPPSWLCLRKTYQPCWKWSFFPRQAPAQTTAPLAASDGPSCAGTTKVIPQGYFALSYLCIWLICFTKKCLLAQQGFAVFCLQLMAYSSDLVRLIQLHVYG